MIADGLPGIPAFGSPDAVVLNAGAFRRRIVMFIKDELPKWRDRPERPRTTDEPSLNEGLCKHLNSASRHQRFDAVQFCHEPLQSPGRHGDIGVSPLGTLVVQGRTYHDFEQLLPIECKRLPTPSTGACRSDLEYIHGISNHRVGGIERFKHGLHGPGNPEAVIVAYVQEESFEYWEQEINVRLLKLSVLHHDGGLWRPPEPLRRVRSASRRGVKWFRSRHRRLCPPGNSRSVEIEHLWLRMN